MRIISKAECETLLAQLAARSVALDAELMKLVSSIIDDVRTRGDRALIDYAARFDKVELEELRISVEQLRSYAASVDECVVQALREAIRNVRAFHERQLEESWTINPAPGVELGQRITPLARVGLYVPGGTAAYPSSVVMNVVPAQVAGVERIVVATPGEAVFWLLPAEYAPSTHVVRERGDQGVLRLTTGSVLSGTVSDVDGKPLAGVIVNARRHEGDSEIGRAMSGLSVADAVSRSAQSDERGEFTFKPLPPGEYRVQPGEYPEECSQRSRHRRPSRCRRTRCAVAPRGAGPWSGPQRGGREEAGVSRPRPRGGSAMRWGPVRPPGG